MTHRVSIIIPCYKQAHLLPQAIESALAQSHGMPEILVVNDGSPDNTREVALSYKYRVRYIERANGGLSAARNTGLLAATGDYVQFLDADDFLYPHMHAASLAVLTAHPKAAAAYCGYQRVDKGGAHLSDCPAPENEADDFHHLLSTFPWPCHTVTVRRSALPPHPVFDEHLRSCEDWDVWLRIASAGGVFKRVEGLGVAYRISGDSMSSNALRMYRSGLTVVRKHAAAHACAKCDESLSRIEADLWFHFGRPALERLLRQNQFFRWLTACFTLYRSSPKPVRAYLREFRSRKRILTRAALFPAESSAPTSRPTSGAGTPRG